jgi:hypothetical protein
VALSIGETGDTLANRRETTSNRPTRQCSGRLTAAADFVVKSRCHQQSFSF